MSRCHARYSPSQRCELDAHGDDKDHALLIAWTDDESWNPDDAVGQPAPVYMLPKPAETDPRYVPCPHGILGGINCFDCGDPFRHVHGDTPERTDPATPLPDGAKPSELGVPIVQGPGPAPTPIANVCAACKHSRASHTGNGCAGRTSEGGESFPCGCLAFA